MGSGFIALADVWAMLEHCAPGYFARATDHHWHVTFNGQTHRSLPLGPHGNRRNVQVHVGQVKKMARHILIFDCAKVFLPQLG